jgi:hypothetical protein
MEQPAQSEWSGLKELPVAVVVGAPAGEARGDHRRWQIGGVLVGERFGSDTREKVLMRSGPDGELFMWRGLRIRLERSEAEDYFLNLAEETPVVYVVVRWTDDNELLPVEVTVSLGEAQAMDSTDLRSVDEAVRTVPMPPEVGVWLAEFAAKHYVPRKKKKRGKKRSSALYDAAVGDFSPDDDWSGGTK